MMFKTKTISFVIFFLYLITARAISNDSVVKKQRWFINTYPSALMTGDFSLGTELNYKRIRQEAAFFYKTFSVLDSYKFDNGFRFSYYLKYNLLKRKTHLLSVDIGYSYRQRGFNNKSDRWTEREIDKNDVKQPSIYLMDRRDVLSGLSFGFSNLKNITKRLCLGLNLNLDLINVYSSYTITRYISGEKVYIDAPLQLEPEFPFKESYVKHRVLFPNFLIKLSYEIF